MSFTESTYENAVIQLFESMGYTHIYAPDMGRADFSDRSWVAFCVTRWFASIAACRWRLSVRHSPKSAILRAAVSWRRTVPLREYLQDGVEVNIYRGWQRPARQLGASCGL